MYQMISHVRFDLQVMPTSQHLWLVITYRADSFVQDVYFLYLCFFLLSFYFSLSFSVFIHSFLCCWRALSLFMFTVPFSCRFLLCVIRRICLCAVFFLVGFVWPFFTRDQLHKVEKKKHTHKNAVLCMRKNENKHLRQIYTLCLFVTYQPNNLAWQQHTFIYSVQQIKCLHHHNTYNNNNNNNSNNIMPFATMKLTNKSNSTNENKKQQG